MCVCVCTVRTQQRYSEKQNVARVDATTSTSGDAGHCLGQVAREPFATVVTRAASRVMLAVETHAAGFMSAHLVQFQVETTFRRVLIAITN